MEDIKIEYAIKGALANAQGEVGILSSTPEILKNKNLIGLVDYFDEILVFKSVDQNANAFTQCYFINPSSISLTLFKIILRKISKFTAYANTTRAYDRREFYFCINSFIEDFLSVYKFLPVPIQYSNIQSCKPLSVSQNAQPKITNQGLLNFFLSSLYKKQACIIKVYKIDKKEETAEVLKFLNCLPPVYKKHIQFGLNLQSGDSLALSALHLFTCINDGDELANLQHVQTNKILAKIASEFMSSEFQSVDDFEISKKSDHSDKANLYELFTCHYIYTYCHLILNNTLNDAEKDDQLNEKIKSLIKTFIENSQLFERVSLLYKCLIKQDISDEYLFNLFWDKYFQNEENSQKKLDSLLDEHLDSNLNNWWRKANNFKGIISVSNDLFPHAKGKQVDDIRKFIKFDYLRKNEELKIQDFTTVILFYKENITELSISLPKSELITKFQIENNYKLLGDEDIRTLLSLDFVNEFPEQIVIPFLKHLGIEKILSYFNPSEFNQIENAIVKKYVMDAAMDKNLALTLIDTDKNWILSLLDEGDKAELSKNLYDHLKNEILHGHTNKDKHLRTLLHSENTIFTTSQIEDFIKSFFVEETSFALPIGLMKTILLEGQKRELELNISSTILPGLKNLNDSITLISSYSYLFDKSEFKIFTKNILETNIWQSANQNINDAIKLSDIVLGANVDYKPELWNDVMPAILEYLKDLDFESIHKNFTILMESYLNDFDFWNAFFKSNLSVFIKEAYSASVFNPLTILEIDEINKKTLMFSFEHPISKLIFELNEILYQKHLKTKDITPFKKVTRTMSLLKKPIRWTIYILVTLCASLIFTTIYFYAKNNNKNKQYLDQDQRADSLKKEIKILKTKNDSLLSKTTKTDSLNIR